MTRSRRGVYAPIASKVSGDPTRRMSVSAGSAAQHPLPADDGPFDLQQLHAEMVRLSQALQTRGLIA